MTIDRVDDTPIVEHNTLTQKIKQKSKKIVMDAEKGKERIKKRLLVVLFCRNITRDKNQ